MNETCCLPLGACGRSVRGLVSLVSPSLRVVWLRGIPARDRNQASHANEAHRSTQHRSICNCVSGHQLLTPKRSATYRSGKLLWLGCLPALLADWRQGSVDSGYVVGGEAPVQLPTHIARVGAGRLGAKGAAQRRGEPEASERRLLLARGAKAAAVANAGGKGHGQLEIH